MNSRRARLMATSAAALAEAGNVAARAPSRLARIGSLAGGALASSSLRDVVVEAMRERSGTPQSRRAGRPDSRAVDPRGLREESEDSQGAWTRTATITQAGLTR